MSNNLIILIDAAGWWEKAWEATYLYSLYFVINHDKFLLIIQRWEFLSWY